MNTLKNFLRVLTHIILYALLTGFFLVGILRAAMLIHGRPITHLAENAPEAPVALVLGAGLNRDGSPGVVLRDRVEMAVSLYFSGKVDKLLMSGDNTSQFYNEPGAMQTYALSLGVPEEDIVLDYAGRRTYDSCFRAQAIFGVDQLIVVTQAFHLPRALFLCNAFGVDASGVAADDANYNRQGYIFWWTREILASTVAFWDLYISQPEPILGSPEPIFP
ncbi:MAG: SanA/YdcF family protein [Brevefilum sp.]